jgi:CHAD domain-containing protein
MAFTLNPNESIRRGLKRLIRKELRRASEHLQHDQETAVHEARTSVKKVRAVVTLLQHTDTGAFEKDARRLRAAGQTLSILRDADAVIATFDHLRTRFPKRLSEHTYAIMRRQLVRAKARLIIDARVDRSLAHVAQTLRAVRRSVKRRRVAAIDVTAVPPRLTDSYRASRKAMRRAHKSTSPSALHRWRKRVKTLWYQLRVAESLAPGLRPEIRRLKQLETWLGDHHNLFVLQTTIANDAGLQRMPADVRELAAISIVAQEQFQRKSFTLGERLLVERPKVFARRLRRAFSPELLRVSAVRRKLGERKVSTG